MGTNPKRPWFRFSLRTMLAACTVLSAWFGWNANIVRQRRAAVAESPWVFLDTALGKQGSPARVSWIRRMMGDAPVQQVLVDESASHEELERTERCPEAQVGRNRRLYATEVPW